MDRSCGSDADLRSLNVSARGPLWVCASAQRPIGQPGQPGDGAPRRARCARHSGTGPSYRPPHSPPPPSRQLPSRRPSCRAPAWRRAVQPQCDVTGTAGRPCTVHPGEQSRQARSVATNRPLTLSLEAGTGRVVTLDAPAASVFAADPARRRSSPSLAHLAVYPRRRRGPHHHRRNRRQRDADRAIRRAGAALQLRGRAGGQSCDRPLLPGRGIHVVTRPAGLVVSGTLESPAEAEQAMQTARDFAPRRSDRGKPHRRYHGSVQVNLRVRIAEVSRNVIRQLGINWTGLANLGTYAAIGIATANPLANQPSPPACSAARLCLQHARPRRRHQRADRRHGAGPTRRTCWRSPTSPPSAARPPASWSVANFRSRSPSRTTRSPSSSSSTASAWPLCPR